MRVLTYVLILSAYAFNTQAQEAESRTERTVEDEAWVLRPKEPTREERLELENTEWMLKTSARHWSGKGEMTPEELEKLRSIYQNEDGKQKIDAFSIITFVEGIENWEGDLVQMLYSREQTYVQSGLNVLSAKMLKGSEHEKNALGSNRAIASRVNDLESLWIEDPNIQGKIKKSKLALDQFHANSYSAELSTEIGSPPPVEDVADNVEELTAPEPSIEESAEVTSDEPSEEAAEKSSNWWLWLIGAVLVVRGLGWVIRRKS